MNAQKLYTPELLALAVELAGYPPIPALPLHGEARSRSCGSTLAIDLDMDAEGRITCIGLAVRACAIGQAAAAIFGRHAGGQTVEEISAAHDAMVDWLSADGCDAASLQPDWPDIALIAAAREYPGRHGAMLLPWKAALAGLSTRLNSL